MDNKTMDDEIIYAVYWRTVYNPRRFSQFAGWSTDYEVVRKCADLAAENKDCIEVRVVGKYDAIGTV